MIKTKHQLQKAHSGRVPVVVFMVWFIICGFQDLYSQEPSVIPDTSHEIKSIKEIPEKNLRTEVFFDTIRSLSSKNRWINELHNIVIRPPQSIINDTLATLRGELEFLQYEGLIIRKISFVKVDVFGASIYDTSTVNHTWLEHKGNSLHIKTNNNTLKRHLLFEEGERVDPRVLADNVRVFRDLSYIEDARITVEPLTLMSGYADVVVYVKDQWSKAFYVELSDVDAGHIEIWDKNIFGTGNEVQNNIYWNPAKSDTWGYEAIYNNRNILGSFIDGNFRYSSVFNNQAYGLQFNRKFLTPDTKYAGGASAFHESSVQSIWSPDSGYFQHPVSSNTSDIWVGRAIKLNKNARIDKSRLNLILATRFYKENYFDRPATSKNKYYELQDKSVWLNSLAVSSQSFYQSNLIYSYGRTEDIPIGSLLNLTLGPEFGEYENRLYNSISFAKGNYISDLGYLYVKIAEGGFINKSGDFEQAMFQFKLKYFSNLFIFGQFKFRQFINFSYTKGVKRFEDERITINEKNGLRGFNESSIVGQQRFAMNWETVTFSPWYIYGFRFSFFGYIDFAMLGPESSNLLYGDVYTGIGFGTRIRNERLVFPTFSFRFGFFPNFNDIPFNERMQFSGEPRLKPDNFYLTNPSMIDYQ